jgi:hypothetical protein
MDIGSILLILALVVPVAVFVARPFTQKEAMLISDDEQVESALLAEQDRILDSIKELEVDYQLEKIEPALFKHQRTVLMNQGAEVLEQLDALRSSEAGDPVDDRAAPQAGFATIPDDEIEQRIAARRRVQRERSGGFCPQCGHAVQRSDRFCSHCGGQI